MLAPVLFFFFFFMDPAPPEIYPLPLHAALPILAVVRAALEAERSLAWRRHDVQRIEPRGDVPRKLEPLEPSPSKQRRVEAITPFLYLPHPRRHVAAQRHDLQIGAEVADLRHPAQAGRPDLGARGQAGDRRDPGVARDQRLGGIGPL